MSNNSTHGAEPDKDTPKRKAAGGCETTTATIRNATRIIALCARVKGATARFMPRFEGVVTANAALLAASMALIVWGLL